MRLASSCTPCRSRKKRCMPIASGKACHLCVKKKTPCDLSRSQIHASTTSKHMIEATHRLLQPLKTVSPQATVIDDFNINDADVLDFSFRDETIDLYFDMIHNKQQILFHRLKFQDDWKSGRVPEYIELGMIALVARFSSHNYIQHIKHRERASPFLEKALTHFQNRKGPVSVYALQGAILLSFACFVEDRKEESSLLSAQALRMVQLLGLPDRISTTDVEREMKIRLYWHAFMMDIWDSARAHIPRQLLLKSSTPLPLDEEVFESLDPNAHQSEPRFDPDLRSRSLWGKVVELTESYAEIVQLVNAVIDIPSLHLTTDSKVEALTIRLDTWLRSLPLHLQDTPDNLEQSTRSGRGREFAVLHLIYHHQSQLLYFRYLSKCLLPPSTCPEPKPLEYAARCKAHAVALSQLMWKTNTTPRMECLWSPLNGHLLVVASAIHLYTLLCDRDPIQTADARKLLEQNYVMLVQFQKYWPTLEASLVRLHALQRSCYYGKDLHRNFQVDGDAWMIEFLVGHQSSLGDRFVDVFHDEDNVSSTVSGSSAQTANEQPDENGNGSERGPGTTHSETTQGFPDMSEMHSDLHAWLSFQ